MLIIKTSTMLDITTWPQHCNRQTVQWYLVQTLGLLWV